MKYLILITILFLSSICAYSQDIELNRLTDIVKSLQSGGEEAYKAAIAKLAVDKMWTPMDEVGIDKAVECKVSDRVPGFKLNSAMTNAENIERYQTTTGNHLNGADSRYNYSLIEKTLKAGKTASFSLPKRWGKQTLIIIPFSGENAKLSASAVSGDQTFVTTPMGNGAIKLTGIALKEKPITLTVTNGSLSNISYVILNHNSRK